MEYSREVEETEDKISKFNWVILGICVSGFILPYVIYGVFGPTEWMIYSFIICCLLTAIGLIISYVWSKKFNAKVWNETYEDLKRCIQGDRSENVLPVEDQNVQDGLIKILCPNCKTVYDVKGRLPGRVVQCSNCRTRFVVGQRVQTRECPYCAEIINAKAIKCKHCGEFLHGSGSSSGSGIPPRKV